MTVFEAYITNLGKYAEGQLVGETLKFPATTEEVQSLLKNIGVDGVRYEEFFITAFDGDVMGLYRAAKATMAELLGGEKLPKMAELKEKRRQLAARKKALYTEYRSVQEEMRQAVAVKANIDHLLGVTDGQRKKEQER